VLKIIIVLTNQHQQWSRLLYNMM